MAVSPGSPPTHNTHLVPPGVCGSWPLLAVWDPRFSWAHRQPTIPINLPQHIAEAGDAQVLDTKMPTQTHRHALSQNTETQSHLPTQREPTNTEQAKETQTLDCAKPRKTKQQKNTNERVFPAPPGAREPQCPRHCTNTYRSSNSEQLLPRQVNHSVVFPPRTEAGGDAGGAGQSSKPTSTTTSQSSRALEKCAKENTRVSTWTGKQLVKTRARVKRRRRAMECHGGRIMECHDDRKRRTRESNVALQDLEKTTPSTRAARGGRRST